MGRFRFGTRSLGCLVGVRPELVEIAHKAIEVTKVDFGIHCGLRTLDQQRALVATGRSLTMDSLHLVGKAFDAHPWIDGNIPWDRWDDWQRLADTMKEAAQILGHPLEWGGDWRTFKDGPHFQLPRSFQ